MQALCNNVYSFGKTNCDFRLGSDDLLSERGTTTLQTA